MFGFTRRQSAKSGNALWDARSRTELLESLTQQDSLATLQGVAELLDAVKSTRGTDPAQAFEAVDHFDRAARPHWRKATNEYYAGPGKLTNYQANRVWTTVGEYIVQLSEAYEHCLTAHGTNRASSANLADQFPRILGRALRLRVSALSWDYVRYVNQFGRWIELYRLYFLAEQRGHAERKVVLYRGGRFCTPEQELMQALMLAVAAPHSMLPEQIDVADRITARMAHYFSLSGGSSPRPYYFDPASDHPPTREQPGVRPPFTARRFGAGEARSELERLVARAHRGDLPLSELGVERHRQEIVEPTLHHLIRYWADAPPERRHARRRDPQRIAVVHGFAEIIAKVGNLPSAYPFVTTQESWLIENTADSGIGALVAQPQGAWAAIGALLAFRYADGSVWNLAAVRHLTEERSERFVGMEVIAQGGVAVLLHTANASPQGSRGGALGVWLAGGDPADGRIRLLLPPGMYHPSSALLMEVHERRYLAHPQRLLAAASDFHLGAYRVTAG
jgi:hypothetical protein